MSRKALRILYSWGLEGIDCEIIDKLIISDSPICPYAIYTTIHSRGVDRRGGVGEKEGLFVRRVERGATTHTLHYSIYPVG